MKMTIEDKMKLYNEVEGDILIEVNGQAVKGVLKWGCFKQLIRNVSSVESVRKLIEQQKKLRGVR